MTNQAARRDPFSRTYDLIRARLRDNLWRPGDQIKVAELAADLRFSPTPVREAVSRLVGESLIEDRRGLGYFVPRLSSRMLAELYALQHLYLAAAVRTALQSEPAPEPRAPGGDRPSIELLFAAILERGGNRLRAEAGANAAARLAPFAAAEAQVLGEVAVEAADIAAIWRARDVGRLRRALAAYHRRRQAAAQAIVDAHERQNIAQL